MAGTYEERERERERERKRESEGERGGGGFEEDRQVDHSEHGAARIERWLTLSTFLRVFFLIRLLQE